MNHHSNGATWSLPFERPWKLGRLTRILWGARPPARWPWHPRQVGEPCLGGLPMAVWMPLEGAPRALPVSCVPALDPGGVLTVWKLRQV